MKKPALYPLRLQPHIRNYVWGGRKFAGYLNPAPDNNLPVAEVWMLYSENVILNGALKGKSLKNLTEEYGSQLVGSAAGSSEPGYFPLLIKLLDCQEWLSVQVHPNDEQAKKLEGPEFKGKTEGWFILNAEPGARLIAGTNDSFSLDSFRDAIQTKNVETCLHDHIVKKDDYLLMPAGTIHALGPGLQVYEIQQNSDTTYRVYDWGRPQTSSRQLHIEKSMAVINPNNEVVIRSLTEEPRQKLFSSHYFSLWHFRSSGQALHLEPQNESFHFLTVTHGTARIHFDGEIFELKVFNSILVPACIQEYSMEGDFQLLLGRLNDSHH
jgi:mannose-6-phosphate isomerase